MIGTYGPAYHMHHSKSAFHVIHIFEPPPYGEISFQVSGSSAVIDGTTMRLGFWRKFEMIGPYQFCMGRTWQSKKTTASPTAASPPSFFDRMRPCTFSWRRMRARLCDKNLGERAMGGFEPSSTTMISAKCSEGVALNTDSTVRHTKSPSLAHGNTTDSVFNLSHRASLAPKAGACRRPPWAVESAGAEPREVRPRRKFVAGVSATTINS
mmetsp:Transcript_35590/g.102709  ORF Transcript_35590/g.102709 Transcript_35590/m.102709 type:complete len:210 (-) Transcript_35590:479-1108(-)